MANEFVALDVETANADLASICQVGVVSFSNGEISKKWQSLINPEDYFDPRNISIHGIDEDKIQDAPCFPEIQPSLTEILSDKIVVSHMPFDRVALTRVLGKYSLPNWNCTWLDSAKISRRAWPQFAHSGYGLASIASWLGISFDHHNAEEDARAAGLILLRAMKDTGLSLQDMIIRQGKPINPSSLPIAREGEANGPFTGQVIVFTGALLMPRHEAAEKAASIGFSVSDSVNKKTTLLVVGDQDIRLLAGHEKSSKHRKAEELISKGQPIRIIGEKDFDYLLTTHND